jgi:hypothetical protein
MSKFTFIQEFQGFGSPKNTMEFEVDQLEDILTYFTDFLRGCGYHFDGHLEIAETYPTSTCNSETYDESGQKEDLDNLESIFTPNKSVIK